MNAELHLRIVGLLLLLLCVMNLYVPRRFRWKEEMASLSLLNRQIFLVHSAFIILILLMFATLVLGFTRQLLEPTPLARVILAGLASFWFARLLVQWFYYDFSIWRGNRFNTIMHFVFTGVWIYFVGTFAAALLLNLGVAS